MDITELSMLLEAIDVKYVTEDEIKQAENKLQLMKNVPQEQTLMLYGLYKQYIIGDINIPKPDESDLIAKYKWDVWKSFEGFPKLNAAIAYVYIVNEILDSNSDTNELSNSGFGSGAVSTML